MKSKLPLVLCCLLLPLASPSGEDERTPLQAGDIGPKFRIEGKFGPLETEFRLKGKVIVMEKTRGPGLRIGELNGKKLERPEEIRVVMEEKCEPGSTVELIAVEKGRLVKIGIDEIVSEPDRSHVVQVRRLLSVHAVRLVSVQPPKPGDGVEVKKEPATPQGDGGGDDPFGGGTGEDPR